MINIFFFILYFVLGASLFLMAHLSDALLLWSSGVAFVCAVTFPSLAIVSQFPNQKDSQSIQHRFFASFFYFILIIAISLVGACFIVTLLSDISFIQSVRSFSGVKLSYILPIFIIGLFFFLRPERLSSTFYVFKRVLFSPIHTVSLIAIISCVLFMVVLILRSGHFFDILILDFEQSLRFFFEQHLFVRPRIKEILIGYPFLLITFIYIDTLISRYWSWFFLILGAVAPISIINSFCHIHTPLYVTLYRTLLGFILGIIFGLMYLILFKFISQIYKRYT